MSKVFGNQHEGVAVAAPSPEIDPTQVWKVATEQVSQEILGFLQRSRSLGVTSVTAEMLANHVLTLPPSPDFLERFPWPSGSTQG